MLVLTRKEQERVRVRVAGVDVWVRVVRIEGDRVRLGFEAPRDVDVRREELIPAGEGGPPR
jgi:carbon storage regulator